MGNYWIQFFAVCAHKWFCNLGTREAGDGLLLSTIHYNRTKPLATSLRLSPDAGILGCPQGSLDFVQCYNSWALKAQWLRRSSVFFWEEQAFTSRPLSCLSCSTCSLGPGCRRCRQKRKMWCTGATGSSSPSCVAAVGSQSWQRCTRGEPILWGLPTWEGCRYRSAPCWNSPAGCAPGRGSGYGTMAGVGWPPCGPCGRERCAGCWSRGCFRYLYPGSESGRGKQRRHAAGGG